MSPEEFHKLVADKTSVVLELEIAKRTDPSRVVTLAAKAADLEGLIANVLLKENRPEKAVANFISQASCLVDANRIDDAVNVFARARDIAPTVKLRAWIDVELQRVSAMKDSHSSPTLLPGRHGARDTFDTILKVFLTIDYLKLCVDHNNPTGDGVPLDIVVMPDFVVDVDGATIKRLSDPNQTESAAMLAPAEVGSRAGRVVSVLAHLRDLDDEGVQIHYITKTGTEGKAILEDRLQRDLRENRLQPLRFPLVTPTNLTRYALLGRDDFNEHNAHRQVLKLPDADVLTPDELRRHFYSPFAKIRQARAVFFATDSLAQFEALVEHAIFGRAASDPESWALSIDEVRDFDRLIKGILQTGTLGEYLQRALLPTTIEELKKHNSQDQVTKSLKEALVRDLNHLISGSSIYEKERFASVKLSTDLRQLVEGNLCKAALPMANRHLLEAAFPQVIANEPGSRNVFIDVSAVTGAQSDRSVATAEQAKAIAFLQDRNKSFAAQQRWHTPTGSRTTLTVMASADATNETVERLFASLSLRPGMDTLILVGDDKLKVHDGTEPQECSLYWVKNQPGSRDAFVAGYLLFRAVGSAWRAIPSAFKFQHPPLPAWPSQIIPDPYAQDSESARWRVQEALNFGSVMACLWGKRTTSSSGLNRWALMDRNWPEREPSFPPGSLAKIPADSQALSPWLRALVRGSSQLLLGQRDDTFVKSLRNLSVKHNLSFKPENWHGTTQTSNVASFESVVVLLALRVLKLEAQSRVFIRAKPEGEQPGKAYLTDLDGTLIQSSSLRYLCLARAFYVMLAEDSSETTGTNRVPFPLLPPKLAGFDSQEMLGRCVRLYNAIIYRNWEHWEAAFENYAHYSYGKLHKDFRQVWNHPLSYPVMIQYLQHLLGELGRTFTLLDGPSKVLIAGTAPEYYEKLLLKAGLCTYKITKESLEEIGKESASAAEFATQLTESGGLPRTINGFQDLKKTIAEVACRTVFSSDITDLAELARRIRNQSDGVSVFLWEHLAETTRSLLEKMELKSDKVERLRPMLVKDLTRIVRGELIYSKERFAGVEFPSLITKLLESAPEPDALARVNRLLLRAAYSLSFLSDQDQLDEQRANEFRTLAIRQFWVIPELFAKDPLQTFHNETAAVEAKYRRQFESACKVFWAVEYEPFRQTREMLQVMNTVLGFKLYVATEGHHDTQVQKLKTVHLDDLMPEPMVLSTGAAAEPHDELRTIQNEFAWRDQLLRALDMMQKPPKRVNIPYRGLVSVADVEKERNYLRLYEEAWRQFEDKSFGGIYCLILASVMVKPDCPLVALTNFKHLLRDLVDLDQLGKPMVFAMTGDREKKDIRPLLETFPPNSGSSMFSVGDLVDLPTFASKLKQSADGASTWLKTQLSPATLTALVNYQVLAIDPRPLQDLLVADLNRIIGGQSIYDVQRFAGVTLRSDTQLLLKGSPQGDSLVCLNRFLLEEAYPLQIAKCPPPVTTVRLLTQDHWNEDLYWDASTEQKRAQFCAWSPDSALHLLNRPDGLAKAIGYERLPALIGLRLSNPDGTIRRQVWDAMIWGERSSGHQAEVYSTVTYLTIQSTARDPLINVAAFAKNVVAELGGENAISDSVIPGFVLKTFVELWRVLSTRNEHERLLSDTIVSTLPFVKVTFARMESYGRDGKEMDYLTSLNILASLYQIIDKSPYQAVAGGGMAAKGRLAAEIQGGICRHIEHRFYGIQPPPEKQAVDIFEQIKPACQRPLNGDLAFCLTMPDQMRRLQALLVTWKPPL
jgi:phosphoglycolate phosphatase-like HAD superfamily hydrolase